MEFILPLRAHFVPQFKKQLTKSRVSLLKLLSNDRHLGIYLIRFKHLVPAKCYIKSFNASLFIPALFKIAIQVPIGKSLL